LALSVLDSAARDRILRFRAGSVNMVQYTAGV
jgi:hypothetical protein